MGDKNANSGVGRSADEPSLIELLSAANRRATTDLQRVLGQGGLPIEQWRVLEILVDGCGRAMSDLAQAAAMKLPSLSKLIDRMVGASMVQRAPDPSDQRKVLVYVTDIGLARYSALRGTVEQHRDMIESRIGPSDGRRLRQLLQAFIDGDGDSG